MLGGKARGASAPGFVLQTEKSGQGKALAPLADDLARGIEARGDEIVGETLGGQEDDLGPDDLTIR